MRIHHLEAEAFGPFAERVALDVDELSAGGLFLVHGPTGSGKTSLLDAVCFALYGDVPGARRKQGLRSDHAAPQAVPEVVLDITVGARRLRITRSPEWQRPKRRGTGTTREQARVVLEEHSGARWSTLSTRNDEVADVVLDVLGMGLSQFAKVVLLPQGDFAAFLRATPEERREVLERLFDIDVYRDVEDWLAEHRRDLSGRLDTARAGLTTGLVRLEDALADLGAVGAEPETEDPVPLADVPVDALPDRLEALSGRLAARLTAAMADTDAATGAEQVAQASLAEGKALDAARARGLQARVRAAALAAEQDAHEAREATVAAAERAATVSGHLVALERAEADVARCADREAHRADSVAALGVATDDVEDRALAERVHALDDTAAELARRGESARSTAREAVQVAEELAATTTRLAATTEDWEKAVAQLEARTRASDELAALAGEVAERRLRLRGASERLALLDAADTDRAAREALAPALVTAHDVLLDAQRSLDALMQARLDGMAATLAECLAPGDPCPVCGSAEHPATAVSAERVTDEHLAAAEARVGTARADLAHLQAEETRLLAAVQTRLAGLDGVERPLLEAELTAAQEALTAATAAATAHEGAQHALQSLRERTDVLGAARTRLDTRAQALGERVDELDAQAVSVADALSAALDLHARCPCGSTDPAAHDLVTDAADALMAGRADLDAAHARRATARADLDAAVTSAGFDDVAAVRAARRPDAEVATLREAVTAHVRETDACGAVLADPTVLAALEGEAPDLDALDAAARAARTAVRSAERGQDTVERTAQAVARLRPTLAAAAADVVGLAERYARVRELADAMAGTGGDNTLRMRLTSFVLAARLEKVAVLANERLRVMGAGRYLLEHTDDRAARGARSGLGLRVLDQWTGRTRDTATLSGGESFMASLALALGLADAVREESGGLDLGTLIVDEGFGSLDEDSLEQVLTVLDGLREGGRAVGVVSHVADLRHRIPYQAVVHKSATGSTVEVRTGAGASSAA